MKGLIKTIVALSLSSAVFLPGAAAVAQDTDFVEWLSNFRVEARAAGIGLVGMKAARHIAGRWFLPWGNPDAFDGYYDQSLREAPLSPFQRSYAYVLAHGLDVVNSDIRSMAQLEENVVAVATSPTYLA